MQGKDLRHLYGTHRERAKRILFDLRQYQRDYAHGKRPIDQILQKDAVCFVAWSWRLLRDVEDFLHPSNIKRLGLSPKRLKRIKR